MAKIAFFTEALPPQGDPIASFAFDLMTALAEQQHEIRVFSTYREGDALPASHPRVEIIRPFRRWSWLELPRVVPILLSFQPDVLHIVQPRHEALQGMTNAMSALPGVAPLLGRAAIISSFYDVRSEELKTHRLLLLASDAVTATNRPQLEMLERYARELRKPPPFSALLPVPGKRTTGEGEFILDNEREVLQAARDASAREALRPFLMASEKLVLVPGDMDQHRERESLLKNLADAISKTEDASVLFGGGWGNISARERQRLISIFEDKGVGSRVFVSGPLSPEMEEQILLQAHLVFVASLPTESLQLTRILREALRASAPIIMSREQADLDSLPWTDRETALLTGQDPKEWGDVLRETLSAQALAGAVRERLPDFARVEALDQPGNIMSRIYAEVLSRKRR